MRSILLALALAGLMSSVAFAAAPRRAVACSLAIIPDPMDRVMIAANPEHGRTWIVVATVLAEKQTSGDLRGGDDSRRFESRFRLEAVLVGDSRDEGTSMTIAGLNYNCPGGGTRLREGEHVLLQIYEGWGGPTLFPLGGKVLIRDGQAYVEDHGGPLEHVGNIEDLIRQIGKQNASSSSQVESSIRAATQASSAPGLVLPLLVGAIPLLLLLRAKVAGRHQ